MRNWIKFDGTSLSTYGLYCSGSGAYNAPARSVEMIQIPGRNGDLVGAPTRLQNMIVTYPCFIAGANFKTNIADLRNFLLSKIGYKKLEDSYNADEYRLAVYSGAFNANVENTLNGANFDLEFNCKPQRFLTSGDSFTDFTANGTINNPTRFAAKPYLKIYGTGQVTIGSDVITIASAYPYSYIEIDCEIGMAYYGTLNANSYVTTSRIDFPELAPGNTGIALGTGITEVKVKPRWWRL